MRWGARAVMEVHNSSKRAKAINVPLKKFSVFPHFLVVHMVAVGEETGAIDTMLTKVAEFYERGWMTPLMAGQYD